jgi:hypothetical protein
MRGIVTEIRSAMSVKARQNKTKALSDEEKGHFYL